MVYVIVLDVEKDGKFVQLQLQLRYNFGNVMWYSKPYRQLGSIIGAILARDRHWLNDSGGVC